MHSGGWAAPWGSGNGTGVRVRPRCRAPDVPSPPAMARTATVGVRSGAVRLGGWPDWRWPVSRIGHRLAAVGRSSLSAMTFITPHRRAPGLGALVGGSVFGALLAAAGLGIAYLALATPLVSVLSADRLSGHGPRPIGLGIVSFSLIAGGALLVAGTNRLAATLAPVAGTATGGPGRAPGRWRRWPTRSTSSPMSCRTRDEPSPSWPSDPSAWPSSTPSRPSVDIARSGSSWEVRTRDGWMPMDNPLDQANRDADQVRRWFTIADLDFVVRVYAAVIVRRRHHSALGDLRRRDPRAAAGLDRCAAPPAQPDRGATTSPPRAGNVSGDAGRPGSTRRRLVGEPGLEPGTSGI